MGITIVGTARLTKVSWARQRRLQRWHSDPASHIELEGNDQSLSLINYDAMCCPVGQPPSSTAPAVVVSQTSPTRAVPTVAERTA